MIRIIILVLTSMNSIKLTGNNCKMLELTLMLILRFVLFRVSIVRDYFSYLDFICFIVVRTYQLIRMLDLHLSTVWSNYYLFISIILFSEQ